MKSFDEMYSSRADLDNEDDDHNRNVGESTKKRPKYILIFVDEINRFVPKIHDTRIMNPVAEQERQFCSLHSSSKVQQIIDSRKIQDYI